jgi:hypothetical protein
MANSHALSFWPKPTIGTLTQGAKGANHASLARIAAVTTPACFGILRYANVKPILKGSGGLVPATNSYANVQLKVEVQVFPPPPACNCSPWCAIGFGTLNGTQTPVYFSGGANPPKGVPPSCGQPQVTVTPPNGPPFDIKPGTGRHQNSGPNAAAGTWTVTTTVCGQSKSCTLTVP